MKDIHTNANRYCAVCSYWYNLGSADAQKGKPSRYPVGDKTYAGKLYLDGYASVGK